MTPYYQDDWLTVYHGDCRAVMAAMPAESVHMVCTSPPYWGLRDYGEPGQLGLEPTPEEYVANLVAVFREVRRVLRADGTVWLNLGDSMATGNTSRASNEHPSRRQKGTGLTEGIRNERPPVPGLAAKQLVGIPWRVAFALQADGWYLRSEIIWSKPNPMPESVTDRPTKSHELIFLLSKSPRYFFDADAVREGIGETGVVEGANGHGEPLVFGQDFRLESQSTYSNAIGVRLAAAILERTRGQHEFGLSVLDAEIGQQGRENGTSARPVGDPIMRRATTEAARFADGDIAAKEFLREVDGLCVALADGHYLKELRAHHAAAPLIDADGDGAVAIDHSREVGQLQLIHDQEYTSRQPLRGPSWQERKAGGATRGNVAFNGNIGAGTQRGIHGDGVSHTLGTATGRNIRSVWTMATQPYPGAHFATFPEALPERCIKAGTSERGVCPECGAPWERVVSERPYPAELANASKAHGGIGNNLGGQRHQDWLDTHPRATTGWRPSCVHDAEPVPATVLDCFAGSGTTGMVAQSLSRRAVLIDLSLDYLGQLMARNAEIPLGLTS